MCINFSASNLHKMEECFIFQLVPFLGFQSGEVTFTNGFSETESTISTPTFSDLGNGTQ